MSSWVEASDGSHELVDEDWTVFLRFDGVEAVLEIYFLTTFVTSKKWGRGITSRKDGIDWCKKQSILVLNQEKIKKGY